MSETRRTVLAPQGALGLCSYRRTSFPSRSQSIQSHTLIAFEYVAVITPSVMVFLDMLQNQRLRRYTAYSAFFKPRGRSPQGLISDKTIGNVKVLVENADESSDHERV